jgi:hypothetical protein
MTDQNQVARIEEKIDQKRAGEISIGAGGLQINDMRDVMEMAKLMAVSAQAVPKHLRGEPGMCLGICIQAIEWRLSPFAVANKSYVVNDRLVYESQIIHSVIEARAPLDGRLRCRYDGENGERTCTVIGRFKGEAQPHEYTSPKLKDIRVKNSPLWSADVDQQLWYYASRAWARKWCPDVLMGIYTPDEATIMDPGNAKDVSPNLMTRLSGRMTEGQGFHPDNVANGTAAPDPAPAAPKRTRKPRQEQPQTAPADAAHAPEAKDGTEAAADTAAAPVPTAEAGIGKFDTPARKTGQDYLDYLRTWTVHMASMGNTLANQNAIAERFRTERALRNDLGTPLTRDEAELAKKIVMDAMEGVIA